jgi:Chaperone of endosialidase
MDTLKNHLSIIVAVIIIIIAGSSAVWALPDENPIANPVAEVLVGPSGIEFSPTIGYKELLLTISFPEGHVSSITFAAGVTPRFELTESLGAATTDGLYTYELRVIPHISSVDREKGNILGPVKMEPVVQGGSFRVLNGSIVPRSEEPGVTTSPIPSGDGISTTQDVCYVDDLIVEGSICVGIDCTCNYSFGFDTLVLKENNLRIFFDDTSSSASFPRNDWRIIINDSSNGGASYFGVEDSTAGRRVFTLEAGAPTHSLYVDDGGRVGLGTSTPVVDLHIKSGNTPTLRLEQDGSSGFTPQTWDVAGNEANFFVRDATNGSLLPLKIKPSTPTNTLFLNASGRIGQGTQSPSYSFHQLTNSSTNAQVVVERTSGATTILAGTASLGFVGTLSNHPLRFSANDSFVMDLNPPGATNDLEMANGARCTSAGVWTDASSRELKENIVTLNADDAIKTLAGLEPVTYNYKRLKDEQYVGFIAEDVPELVAINDRKGLAPMDIVAVLTKVVQQQQQALQSEKKHNQNQQHTIELLKLKMIELEKKLHEK